MKSAFQIFLFGFALVAPSISQEPGIPALVATHKDVVYGEAGGQKQLMDIYFPNMKKPEKPAPAILCVHGGAWRSGSKNDVHPVALPLTKEGFVAVGVGYRLFDPQKHPDNIWPAQLDDVQRCVRYLRANAEKYGIDPERIGAVGFSAGGHLVSLLGTQDTRDNSDKALAKFSSRVQAVVNVFGPSDLTMDYSKLKMGEGTVQDLVDDFLGRKHTGEAAKKVQREASPLFFVNEKTAPHFIYHGDKDPIVPVENSRKLEAALKKADVAVEYMEAKGEGHGIGPQNLAKFTERMKDFLHQQLGAGKTREQSAPAGRK